MKKYGFIGAFVALLVLASCGGGRNVTQLSGESLKEEIIRTSSVIEEGNTLILQMKSEFHPELCDKLKECFSDVEFMSGRDVKVSQEYQADLDRQISKIEDFKIKMEPVLDDYIFIEEFTETSDEAVLKAKDAVAQFSNSLLREDYEKAKEAVVALKPKEAQEMSVPVVRNAFKEKKQKVEQVYSDLNASVKMNEMNVRLSLMQNPELMIENRTLFPYFLNKGDILYVDVNTTYPTEIKLWDSTTRKLVKTLGKKTKFSEKIKVDNSSIYVIEILPTSPLYFNIAFSKSTAAENWDKKYNISTVTEECDKSGFMAYPVTTIEVQNIFQEPRKLTLRSGLKALFSGSTSSSVALNIPSNASNIAYQLRISTNKSESARDGEFCGEMTRKTKNIKIFGTDIVSIKKESTNIIREILNEINKPEKDEEAYASMYVTYDSNSAKSFQEGTDPSSLKYDVNYSIVQTQSTNGSIPVKATNNLYLCFANERTSANVYIWLEAVATVNVTKYYHSVYKLE